MKTKLRNYKLCNLKSAILNSEDGMVLIVALLLLLVATVVGITALSTSTTNVMIAGNKRLSEMNFTCADSGVSVAIPIIENSAFYSEVSSDYTGIVPNDADFLDEVGGASPMDSDSYTDPVPDIQFTTGSSTVSVDVDYLYATYAEGGAIEFASAYDGLGKGAGGGSGVVHFRVNSACTGDAGSMATVGACYRYVIR